MVCTEDEEKHHGQSRDGEGKGSWRVEWTELLPPRRSVHIPTTGTYEGDLTGEGPLQV